MVVPLRPMPALYTRPFLLLCFSYFLFFASFNMVIPELPSWLDRLGGGEYKGLIIGLFALAAMISRPVSGRLTDTLGRKPVIFFGVIVCLFLGLLYPVAQSVALFLVLRFSHGFSTGFTPTGASAYVADIVPDQRRGEAMGIIGLFGSLGMALGPYLGSSLVAYVPQTFVFYFSSGFALLSGVVLLQLPETLAHPQAFSLRLFKINTSDVFEPRVIVPATVVFLTVVSFGIVLTLVPDLSDYLGINRGLFFLCFTLASVGVRFFAGKLSDKVGRASLLIAGGLLLAASMTVTAFAANKFQLMIAAVLFGFAAGINSPTSMAWTVDLSLAEKRGRALATMFIALEAGIFLGSVLSGWVYNNQDDRFTPIFLSGAGVALLSVVYLLWVRYQQKKALYRQKALN